MWLRAGCRMPYYADPDYRLAVVQSIKQRFGDVPVEVQHLEVWGSFEVYISERNAEEALAALPLIGSVRRAVDREMCLGVPVTM